MNIASNTFALGNNWLHKAATARSW